MNKVYSGGDPDKPSKGVLVKNSKSKDGKTTVTLQYPNGKISTVLTDSQEYRELYKKGNLYTRQNDGYIIPQKNASKHLKDFEELQKKYPQTAVGNKYKDYIDMDTLMQMKESQDYEKEYLNSPKFKERVERLGLDVNKERKKISDKIDNTIPTPDVNIVAESGASITPFEKYPKLRLNKTKYGQYTDVIPHEIGHLFSEVNRKNKDYINARNGYAITPEEWKKDWGEGQRHEADYLETIADVHSTRQVLKKLGGTDLRYGDMTDKDYDLLSNYLDNFDDLSGKNNTMTPNLLFNKIGVLPDEIKSYVVPQRGARYKNFGTENYDVKPVKDPIREAHRKKKIMEIMNKVVYNDNKSANSMS